MDMNNTPEPRMPLVENLEFLDLMGVISSPCTTSSASTRASAIAHRVKFTRKACGYVDDRRCRPAVLPPLPERAQKAGEMLAFAHIPTGTTINKGIDVEDLKSRGAAAATAMTTIGADIETGGATP
jgi:hypothetical protein